MMTMKLAAVAAAALMAGCSTAKDPIWLHSEDGPMQPAGMYMPDQMHTMMPAEMPKATAEMPKATVEMKPETKYTPEKKEAPMVADMVVEKKTMMKKQHKWVKE